MVLRLLAPFPLGMLGIVLGIVQVIGAIVQRLGFRASSEKISLELPLLTFELFDFLLECGDAEQGTAMATLPYPTCWRYSRFSRSARTSVRSSTNSWHWLSARATDSGKESLGQRSERVGQP